MKLRTAYFAATICFTSGALMLYGIPVGLIVLGAMLLSGGPLYK